MKIWELIATLGGFTVLIVGILTYVGKKIADSLFKLLDGYQAKRIEILKGEISRQNSFINQIAADHSKEFHESAKKRIEAIDCLWKEILKVKELGQIVFFMDSFMTYDEIENAHMSKNPNTKAHLSELKSLDLSRLNSTGQILEYRPYISSFLWLNYELYTRLLARSIILLRKDINTEYWWKKDKFIAEVLASSFNEEEKDFFNNRLFGGLTAILQLIEQKILNEIKMLTTGEHASENSLKHIKNLMVILSENKEFNMK